MSSLTRFRWVCLVAGICLCGCADPVKDAVSTRFPEPAAGSQSETVTLAGVSAAEEAPAAETTTGKALESQPQKPDSRPEKMADAGESLTAESQDEAPAANAETREAAEAQATVDESPANGLEDSWPMAGGSPGRNAALSAASLKLGFDPEQGDGVLWTVPLGSQTYGNPVVAQGRVFIATNNSNGYRPGHPGAEDRGVLLCFDAEDGAFRWQLTREKLPGGSAVDWPLTGICSTPCIDGDRLYVMTNRCELMCLDVEGFEDGENDGPVVDEVDRDSQDADIVWTLDFVERFGVQPHNTATSNPLVYGDLVYTLTSNGVDESHERIPAPEAPSFVAVNKRSGEVVWQVTDVSARVLHGQWASPALGVVQGQAQVYFPGGDGWLYAYDALTGELLWKCDLNPKASVWNAMGRGDRNTIVATPVFHQDSVLIAVGDDPEFGDGIGHLWRIDATKRGDVSLELGEAGKAGEPNPNSAVIWHYGGLDTDGSVTGEEGAEVFRRTISSVVVTEGLVLVPDFSGRLHAVDWDSGKRLWEVDLLSAIWASPVVIGQQILLADEDGELTVFPLQREAPEPTSEILFGSAIYGAPAFVNGVLFVADREKLYALRAE